MANGFRVADIGGRFRQGQQFSQQQAIQANQLVRDEQLAQQQQQEFAQQQQQIDVRSAAQKNKDLGGFLLRLQATPDEQKGALLERNIAEVTAKGGNPDTSVAGLELFNAGKIDELNSSADNILNALVRQGDIKAPAVKKLR